jgi:uncharacterized protein YbjQ (UPF0145 family)
MEYLDLIISVSLLTVGYVVGQWIEKKHFKSIIEREERYRKLLTFNERFPPKELKAVNVELVCGNVVISIDYFKRIAAGLRGLIGGRVSAYATLIERARREAILRMKESAHKNGATMIINVRLETASLSKGQKQQIGSVEVYADGTAIIPG